MCLEISHIKNICCLNPVQKYAVWHVLQNILVNTMKFNDKLFIYFYFSFVCVFVFVKTNWVTENLNLNYKL